jgi:hypothetical protein
MQVSLSKAREAGLAVAGHAGCGHCHSHSQYIQDDSGGLATVLSLFREATGTSLTIRDIRIKAGLQGNIEVETEGGGRGKAAALRGITPQEARLAQSLVGREAILTQALVLEAFGRFYGQGVSEKPVALQAAIANAALDSFVRSHPEHFAWGTEENAGNFGIVAGTVLDINGIPTAVLGTVNASAGGIGPNEDLEGNIPAGGKGRVMKALGMVGLPTIILEGKVYTPAFCSDLKENTFLVRADNKWDNPYVARALYHAAEKLKLPVILRDDVMRRVPGTLRAHTEKLGEQIVALGQALTSAETSREKITILSELATRISQDAGGISFMTNRLHDLVGGVGMAPGTSAVLSLLVTEAFHDENIFPAMSEEDLQMFVNITKQAVTLLAGTLPEAADHQKKHGFSGDYNELIGGGNE